MRYEDTWARWKSGGNSNGEAELREYLARAKATGMPVRAVLAIAKNKDQIDPSHGSFIKNHGDVEKTFDILDGWIGHVAELDDKGYVIEFRRELG